MVPSRTKRMSKTAHPWPTPHSSRREFLASANNGFGMLALTGLLGTHSDAASQSNTESTTPGFHFPPRAKRVIFCFMDGGPSHVDTFDYKPALTKYQGQRIGQENVSTRSQGNADRIWLGSPWRFRQRGQSGLWVSDLLPQTAELAKKLIKEFEGFDYVVLPSGSCAGMIICHYPNLFQKLFLFYLILIRKNLIFL